GRPVLAGRGAAGRAADPRLRDVRRPAEPAREGGADRRERPAQAGTVPEERTSLLWGIIPPPLKRSPRRIRPRRCTASRWYSPVNERGCGRRCAAFIAAESRAWRPSRKLENGCWRGSAGIWTRA